MLAPRRLRACSLFAIVAWLLGCGNEPTTSGNPPAGQPQQGATEFVSADTNSGGSDASHAERGGATKGSVASVAPQAAPSTNLASDAKSVPGSAAFGNSASADPGREVERGDIYRVLPDHRILNLNRYRGVQVIDISDVNAPRLEGRLAVAGEPVEMYVVGDHALVLLNNWQGYYGGRDDVSVESVNGGLVMSVDISDRAHPTLADQATVPGYINTSRLTQGGKLAALYVAANEDDETPGNPPHTVVKSFDVTGNSLVPKSELDLGGNVQDIQATSSDVLLVASYDYQQGNNRSRVSLIDISSPEGTMVQGGFVIAAGVVQNKFNMDAYNGMLRVVSGVSFAGPSSGQENHLETFDMHDLSHPIAVDDCRFGAGQQLEGTLFLENRGFFVTYLRKDPFHAFSIDDKGHCQEHGEFVVSGWNDFFRAALGDTRLIGFGRNDENQTSHLSVSLYDASDLTNPNPLIARSDVDLANGYSNANWDDRAFTVLEGAASARAADGSEETGLVLLPYEGWDQAGKRYVAEVQIFTFSDHTLTLRGKMDHGSEVTRSFVARASTAANLSDEQLSLFDTTDVDAPKEQGRLDLAPNYSRLFVFGSYVARVKDRGYYITWGSDPAELPDTQVEILSRSANIDSDAPLTTLAVPASTELVQVGSLLVGVMTTAQPSSDPNAEPKYQSEITVYDLSDPTQPQRRGSLATDRLRPSYGGYGDGGPVPGIAVTKGGIADCLGECGGFGGGYTVSTEHYTVGNAIVFVRPSSQQRSLGMVHECSESAPGVGCSGDSSGNVSCPTQQVTGSVTCRTPAGGNKTCSGGYYLCDSTTGTCSPTARPANVFSSCYDYENVRYWTADGFDALDLRDPSQPKLGAAIDGATDEEATSLLADGKRLFFNFQKPDAVSGDGRDQVKHYVRALDFSDPLKVSLGGTVNVPGDVIASDANTIYTRDLVWGELDTQTLVARLTLDGSVARLQASRTFESEAVQAVKLDGHGHILVSGDPAGNYGGVARISAPSDGSSSVEDPKHTLDILDAKTLEVAGHAAVDAWATFQDAKMGRALYSVSGGLLVIDVQDAAHPKAQAYFPTLNWPSDLYFDGDEVLFAAGPYGVYRFDAGVQNLLAKP